MSIPQTPIIQSLPAEYKHTPGMGYFIEYYFYNPETDEMERKRMRANKYVKRVKGRHAKMLALKNICDELNNKLEGGWSPMHETENARLYTRIADLAEKFIQYKEAEGCRPATLTSYRSMTSLFLRWCEDTGRIRKHSGTFLKIDAVAYMDSIMAKKVSSRSYNNTIKCMRVFFSWAVEHCYAKENPFAMVKKLENTPKRRTLIDHDSRARISAYLAATDPQFLIVCKLIYYSAMRPREITNIQLQHIDLDGRYIYVPGENSKNHKSRHATLTKDLIDSLQYVKQYQNKDWFLFGMNDQLTPARQHTAFSNFRKRWDKLRTALKLPAEMQLYSLRDTGLTDYLHAGIDALTVQHHADHSSLEVQSIYTSHFDPLLNEKIYNLAPDF